MQYLPYFFFVISGFSGGFVTAAAFVAFIAMLGIFPKIAAKTKTASECILYENCLILGILLATLLQFFLNYTSANYEPYSLPILPIGILLICLYGSFGGIYIGFLIGGLSEVLNVFPIFSRKTHIQKNVIFAIYSLALGKGFYTLLQFLVLNNS